MFFTVLHTMGIIFVWTIFFLIVGISTHHGATGGAAVGYGIGATLDFVVTAISHI